MRPLASGVALLLAAAPAEAHVADGETLVIGGTAVQIVGIDAPRAGTQAGDAARAEMRALVSGGHALDCGATSAGRYRALEPAGARERLPQSADCAVPMR
ncbi:MAG: hypothetical protein V2I65_05380 [Paracoccaceae bacterium]|jgi:endonuclease YncB( thermonuclease family)|nr:hypothetical protein [Paracoccaceae bacterium]